VRGPESVLVTDGLLVLKLALVLFTGGLGASGSAQGQAFHYHPPTGERICKSLECVYTLRRARGQIAPRPAAANALVSVPLCSRLGQVVEGTVGGRILRGYVVDCSQPAHRAAQARRGLIVETDWAFAARGGWATYGGLHGNGHAPATLTRFWSPANRILRK
jgi:hypothetical protein